MKTKTNKYAVEFKKDGEKFTLHFKATSEAEVELAIKKQKIKYDQIINVSPSLSKEASEHAKGIFSLTYNSTMKRIGGLQRGEKRLFG